MSIPSRHHYLPAFYLRAWERDGKVCDFRRPRDKLVMKLRSAEATGFEEGLYSLPHEVDPVAREQVELEHMQRIDTDAAAALRRMVDEPGMPLADRERDGSIQFLIAQLVRTPARLEYFDKKVRAERFEFTDEDRSGYAAVRADDDPATPEDSSRLLRGLI